MPTPAGPVAINVNVTNFVPLSSVTPKTAPFFSVASLSMPGTNPNVATGIRNISRRPFVAVSSGQGGGHPLPNGITLSFTVTSSIAGASFVPIGISFIQYAPNAAASNDPDGTLTFDYTSIAVAANTLSILDNWNARHGPNFGFMFFLVVQRDDGAIGIIDPDIENDN